LRARLTHDTVVATRDLDELTAAYASVYVEPKIQLVGDGALQAVCAQRQVGRLRVGYGFYGAATEWNFPNADCYLYLLALGGSGKARTRSGEYEVAAGRPVTMSPAAGFRGTYAADFAGLSVKPDSALLPGVLESMTGTAITAPLVFEPQTDRRAASPLQAYLRPLVATLESVGPAGLPDWWAAQTEHMISVLLLSEERHNYSHLLESRHAEPSLAQLHRAEEFIAANAERPITAEDLARITGVSVLSLYRGFKKVHGCTPLAFAAARRRDRH
jgi:hypothetical protein